MYFYGVRVISSVVRKYCGLHSLPSPCPLQVGVNKAATVVYWGWHALCFRLFAGGFWLGGLGTYSSQGCELVELLDFCMVWAGDFPCFLFCIYY